MEMYNKPNKLESVLFIFEQNHTFFQPLIDAIIKYKCLYKYFIFDPKTSTELNSKLEYIVNINKIQTIFVCGEYFFNLRILSNLKNIFLIRLGGDDDIFYNIYTRNIASYFNINITTSFETAIKLKEEKVECILIPILYSQLSFNNKYIYKYDLTFCGKVGIKHNRSEFLNSLKNNYNIKVFGSDIPGNYLSYTEMMTLYKQSKINLNFSGIDSNKINITKITGEDFTKKKQLKGRIFEVLQAGGFLLTENSPGIENYFDDGIHLVIFNNQYELEKQVNYYLTNDHEREKIRLEGFNYVKKYSIENYISTLILDIEKSTTISFPKTKITKMYSKYIGQTLANNEKFNFINLNTSYNSNATNFYIYYMLRKNIGKFVKHFFNT